MQIYDIVWYYATQSSIFFRIFLFFSEYLFYIELVFTVDKRYICG